MFTPSIRLALPVSALAIALTSACRHPAPPPAPHGLRPPPATPIVDPPDSGTAPHRPLATLGAGPFPTFGTLDDTLAAWQGTWLVEASAGTPKQVWDVHGRDVTIVDARGQRIRTLTPLSPCLVEVASTGPTGRSADLLAFGFDGATLYVGLGEAGVRKGGSLLACAGQAMVVWKDGACRAFRMDTLAPHAVHEQPGQCQLRSEGDHEILAVHDPDQPEVVHTLRTYGPALMSESMRAHPSVRVEDLAAGKAALHLAP